MSEPAMILIGGLAIMVASVVVHEGAHLLATRMLGGTFHGLYVRWYGIGVKADIPQEKIWLVALAGLAATAFLSLGFLAVGSYFGFVFNATILFVNMIPHRMLDGGHVFQHFRSKFLADRAPLYDSGNGAVPGPRADGDAR